MAEQRRRSEIKNFLHVKDFYNWIKDKSGDNVPASFYWFTVNFYQHVDSINSTDPTSVLNNNFFKNYEQEIITLRYCVQQVDLPEINFTGYNTQGNQGEGTLNGSNMFGTYTVLGNSYIGIERRAFTMKILNTQSPIIERFIYPWMIECLQKTDDKSSSIFPRMDMTIKFWKPNNILPDMENQAPEFVYYIRGMFPSKIQPYRPVQQRKSVIIIVM